MTPASMKWHIKYINTNNCRSVEKRKKNIFEKKFIHQMCEMRQVEKNEDEEKNYI